MKTYSLKAGDVVERWHVLDAEERPLGRLASEVAVLLRGKHRPTFTPHMDNGDFVVVVNASKVKVTGAKMQQKLYYRHSGYPGGLKETPLPVMLERHPERVIQQAVKGMLPHNKLGRKILRHLKVYGGPDHPHEAQVNAGTAKAKPQPDAPAAKKEQEPAPQDESKVEAAEATAAGAVAEAPAAKSKSDTKSDAAKGDVTKSGDAPAAELASKADKDEDKE